MVFFNPRTKHFSLLNLPCITLYYNRFECKLQMANIKPLQHFLLIFYLKSIYKIVFKYYLLFLILITPCHNFNTCFNPHDKRAKKIFYIGVGDNCSVLLPFNSQDIESVILPADYYTFSWKLPRRIWCYI